MDKVIGIYLQQFCRKV